MKSTEIKLAEKVLRLRYEINENSSSFGPALFSFECLGKYLHKCPQYLRRLV